MSYSRWHNSYWYTFWQYQEEPEDRDTAIFSICCVVSFTAKELRDDIDACIEIVKGMVETKLEENPKDMEYEFDREDGVEPDYEELKGYMKRFLRDVDEEFPKEKETKFKHHGGSFQSKTIRVKGEEK